MKITFIVGLPKGVTEPNFGNSVGIASPKKSKMTGQEIKTKMGKAVYSFPLNLTKLRAMTEKYPQLVKNDNRSGDKIVWLNAFEMVEKGKANGGGW